MKKNTDKIEVYSISELQPYERNNKKHPKDQIKKIAKSIEEFGFRNPVIIDGNKSIIAGHGRVEAAKILGFDTVPCILVDDLTPEQIKAFRIMDNKSAESEYDFDNLALEFDDLNSSGYNLEYTGFDLQEIKDICKSKEPLEVEEVEADDVETIHTGIKEGDIFTIGNHRLMCGDSTNYDVVKTKLCVDKNMNMLFTDPPYLMGFEGNVHADGSKSHNAKHGSILNDKMTVEDGQKFIDTIFAVSKEVVAGSYYVCFYRLGLHYIFNALQSNKISYKAVIIWEKGNHTLSNSDYMSRYEPIVYGWFKEHKFYGNRSNFDVWNITRTQKNELHPTMKPIELCARAIQNSSEQNGLVLDLFGGSGSTMVACEQLNRACYMMELDPKYCQVIINRMLKLNPNIEIKCENRDFDPREVQK